MPLINIDDRERLAHPWEDGAWIEIRPLLATEMDEAKNKRQAQIMQMMGPILDQQEQQQRRRRQDNNQDLDDDVPWEAQKREYDYAVVAEHAVVGWSYDAPVNPGTIRRLDTATRDWVVEEVLKRNLRPLPKPLIYSVS